MNRQRKRWMAVRAAAWFGASNGSVENRRKLMMNIMSESRVRAMVLLAAVFANGVLLPAHGALPAVTSATLKLHLDAALGVTDAGAGAVSAWADQSGLGNNFEQTTAGLRPVLTASQINGLPAVMFTLDRLDAVGTGLNTTTALPFTFFAVTVGASLADQLFDSAPSAANLFRFGAASGQVELWNGSPSVLAPVNVGGSVLSIAANFQSPEGSSRRELSVRAFSSASVTNRHGYIDSSTQVPFTNPDIGTQNGGAPYFSGGIAEMLIYYGPMTVPDRFAVEQYLREKYNLSPVVPGVPERLPVPVITAASTRYSTAHSQENPWNGDVYQTSNNTVRADEYVDFDFGAPTMITQFAYRDVTGHDVSTFDLIFSADAVFGNGDDITQSVNDGGWHADGVQYAINGGNGYTVRYVRWKVTATSSDIAGSSLFAFYTTLYQTPPTGGVVRVKTVELEVAGWDGTTLQWQKSVDGGTWDIVSGAQSAVLNVTALYTNTPYFRVNVTRGTDVAYSTRMQVTSQTVPSGTVFMIR